jgi:hypothetical protein
VSDNEKPSAEVARTTLALTPESGSTADPMQAAEARMRRALGLDGEQARPRPAPERVEQPQRQAERFSLTGHKRRFVHDGEVPVTLVHGLVPGRRDHAEGNGARNGHAQPTNRLEVAEAALAAEITTRERAERAYHDAQAAVHDLRTKLGHADLARQEAVETLRRERESTAELRASFQELQEQLATARQAQQMAETALAELQERQLAPLPEEEVLEEEVAEEPPPRPRRGRKPRAETVAKAERTTERTTGKTAGRTERSPAKMARSPAKAERTPAAAKPRKGPGRPRKDATTTREQKPIRWWLSPRSSKKR